MVNESLTRFSASSHACFISVALALFTLTSSLTPELAAVASRPEMALELVELVLAASGSSADVGTESPLTCFLPLVAMFVFGGVESYFS